MAKQQPPKLRLGVSACLLGAKVRHDGQHKRNAFLVDVLGPFVEWVPVCPELELGLGVPREPIRLVGHAAAPRLVAERSGKDLTEAMRRFADARVREVEKLGLAGWVTKKDSPSCGMERVRVHSPRGGPPRRDGVGMFVAALSARMPLLPIEEEGRLEDPALRESFVERIFAYARLQCEGAHPGNRGGGVAEGVPLHGRMPPFPSRKGQMSKTAVRKKPALRRELCKGCGRCVESCAQHAITIGTEVHPASGFVPIDLDLGRCNACGLCIDACPEPFGLLDPDEADRLVLADAAPPRPRPAPEEIPPVSLPLRAGVTLFMKGAHAGAVGALLAGCRYFYGYPITPSTEGAELMSKLLPEVGGTYVQAPSEVAAVNMMYGAGAAGRTAMTFTSSPGFSLMLEGISYMVSAELPGVFVNVMRAGPGLGNVGPAQADVKLACRGLGHGDTHAVVLAPATPQEMLDFTVLAFDLAARYRSPVVVLADGFLGQMTGRVVLPERMVRPGLPAWSVPGDAAHRGNLVTSILLDPHDFEGHNRGLVAKYARMTASEQRAAPYLCDDADVLLVACNTPSQLAKGAVRTLREQGIRAGLFRPQTLWPFPVNALLPHLERARRIVVVEASDGQIEDELRLALSHANARPVPISHVRRLGGVLPTQAEIVRAARGGAPGEVAA